MTTLAANGAMAMGPREGATAARREAIMAAALELFLARGIAGTTIEQIRARSGASVGSIYHHFGSKQAIASALYLEGMRSYHAGVLAQLDGAACAQSAIEGAVRYHASWVQQHADLARFLAHHREPELRLATERPLRDANREFFRVVLARARRLMRQGHLRELPADLLYPIWIAPVQEASRAWLDGRSKTPLAKAAATLADAAWEALRPKGAHR